MQFDKVMSIMRYWPANGTAGLARSRVRGKSLSPAPPASRTPSVSLIFSDLRAWVPLLGCTNAQPRPGNASLSRGDDFDAARVTGAWRRGDGKRERQA